MCVCVCVCVCVYVCVNSALPEILKVRQGEHKI